MRNRCPVDQPVIQPDLRSIYMYMYMYMCIYMYLFALPHCLESCYRIMSEQPKAVCGLAYDCVQRLSPIVRQIDFALDWTELEAGKALYRYTLI